MGAGKREGPSQAMTQIQSGLVRELECVESRSLLGAAGCTQRDFSQKRISATGQGPHVCHAWASEEGGVGGLSAPTQGAPEIDQTGAAGAWTGSDAQRDFIQ